MDILAKVNRDTYLYNRPIPDSSFIASKIEKDTKIHIYEKKKYGLDVLYKTINDLYIAANDVQILRDLEFYYKNYKSNALNFTNINLNGANGLSGLTASKAFGFGSGLTATNSILPTSNNDNDIYGLPDLSTIGGSNTSTDYNYTPSDISLDQLIDGSSLGTLVGNLLSKKKSIITENGYYNNLVNFVLGFEKQSSISPLKDKFQEKWLASSASIQTAMNSSNRTNTYIDPNYRQKADLVSYDTNGIINSKQIESRQIKYTQRTEAMKKYFSFYYDSKDDIVGIADTSKIREWSKDNSVYDTSSIIGTPTRPIEEVNFYKSIDVNIDKDGNWSNLWSDALATIREEFNLDIDRKTIFEKFNRFRVPTPDNELTYTRGYVYFTRPDLNTDMMRLVGNKVLKGTAHAYPLMSNMNHQHGTLMKYLVSSRDKVGCNHDFIPILTHACTGFDISDEVLETDEVGETFTGWKFVYGRSLTKSKTAGTVNITFTDDNMLSIYKMFKVWTEYIHAVWRGECDPYDVNADKHILDYAISIYYFLTKANGEDILFFTKLTGCFPTAVPSSNFSDTLGTPIKRPNYTIPFIYTRKDDYNPIFLAEFNHLSDENNHEAMPIYNENTLTVHKSFVGAPFVHTTDGMYTYQLKHRAASGDK